MSKIAREINSAVYMSVKQPDKAVIVNIPTSSSVVLYFLAKSVSQSFRITLRKPLDIIHSA